MSNLAQNNQNQNYYSNKVANQTTYPFILPDLPYPKNAFEPNLSEKSFDFHHGKHHNAYVTNLNNFLKDDTLNTVSLEDIMLASYGDASKAAIFNNAAQVWNHTFFWHSISPNGGGMPKGKLAEQINKDFGSYDQFKEQFKAAGVGQFGSGWAWLVLQNDKLAITKTSNADTPLVHNQKAILGCDVWEHAYYLDYQNRRPDFLDVFLGKLVNWDFAESNFLN